MIKKIEPLFTIYLLGYSGTGKYTIAKELKKIGFRIADNQLANNPIFELVGYDGTEDNKVSDEAWDAIKVIRDAIFDFIKHDQVNNYVLTNVLYDQDEGDLELYNQVKVMAEARNSIFVPVKLSISVAENNRRIINRDRMLRFKQIVPSEDRDSKNIISIESSHLLELDVTNIPANETAKIIWEHANRRRKI